jgi:hypothetical protein
MKLTALWATVLTAAASPSPYTFHNARQHLDATFANGRSDFQTGNYRFSLTLAAAPVTETIATADRIEFRRGPVTEWFVNGPGGIEQGFTLTARPATLTLQVGGDLIPALDGADVVLRAGSRTVFRYGGLKSWDADGRVLPSRVIVDGSTIRLEVDDSQARYPVTVDPVVKNAGLQGSTNYADLFGAAAAVDGNVAVIGAPGARSVSVYTRTAGVWTLFQVLQPPPDSGGGFGAAVAVSGGIIVVGDPSNTSCFIYGQPSPGSLWAQQADLSIGAADGYVQSVAVGGNTVAVGTTNGMAVVFTEAGTSWTPQPPLYLPGVIEALLVGYPIYIPTSVAIDGGTIVVAAPKFWEKDVGAINGGAVIYTHTQGSGWSQTATIPLPVPASDVSVAISGSTIVLGDAGSAYTYAPLGTGWIQQDALGIASPSIAPPVAIHGQVLVVADYTAIGGAGTAFVFSLSPLNGWIQQTRLALSSPYTNFGGAVALSGDTLLVGGGAVQGMMNLVEAYDLTNVALSSLPAGRTFTLSGTGCGTTGVFTTPYAGNWTSDACTVDWTTPDTSTPGTQYVLQQWSDGSMQNPRSIALPNPWDLTDFPSYSANFQTQYQLTTQSVPLSGGSVTGAAWYNAGATGVVAAFPNPGFVFTGFSGGLSGGATPQTLAMNAPTKVDADFVPTPPAALSPTISAKSGAANDRVWTIGVTNSGPGTAYAAQLSGLMLTQTFGTACAPVRLSPVAFPVVLGTLPNGSSAQTAVAFDFSSCASTARFTASLDFVSNGGSSVGLIQLANQLQ